LEPGGVIVLVALLALFWIFLIRPQRRRLHEQRQLHESVAVGDEIVTLGGLIGRVRNIDEQDNTLELEVAPGTNVRVVRHGVAAVLDPEKAHEEFIRNDEEPS
jgi:preprotein translocase subunit YajC